MSTFSSTAVRTGASNVPTPIANCSFVTAGNICFVFGGTDSRGSCYNDMRYLDLGPYLDPTDISVSEGSRSDYSFKILVIGDACTRTFLAYHSAHFVAVTHTPS